MNMNNQVTINADCRHEARAAAVLATVVFVVVLLLATCTVFPGLEGEVENGKGDSQAAPDPNEPHTWPTNQGLVTGRYYEDMVADPEFYFGQWYDMGLSWIRIEFEEFMNLADRDYDSPAVQANVEKFRNVIAEAHDRGIKVLGIIGVNSMPDWVYVDKATQTVKNDGIDRYIESVRWHLETYDIDAIEIWNEPRQFTFTDFDVDNDGENELAGLPAYAELLVETYSQVKPDYPDVTFVAPATSNAFRDTYVGNSGEEEYSIFNADIMRSYRDNHEDKLPLDAISWHPYGRTVAEDGGPLGSFYYGQTFADYHENVLSFTDLDGRPVVGDYPIWLTEYGFETNQTGGLSDQQEGEETQREYYEDMLTAVAEYPQIELAFLYTYLDDDPNASGTQNMTYGIRRSVELDYEPKEIYYAFTAANSSVGVRPDGTIDAVMVTGYLDAGGRESMGEPTSGVYEDGALSKQNFSVDGAQKILVREESNTRVE